MSEFLPCMCCGSNRIIHFKTSKNRGYATCIDCGMRTRGCGNYENKDDLKWRERATILWNHRKPTSMMIAKLQNYYEELQEKALETYKVNKNNREYEMINGKILAVEDAIDIIKKGGKE